MSSSVACDVAGHSRAETKACRVEVVIHAAPASSALAHSEDSQGGEIVAYWRDGSEGLSVGLG